MSDTRVTRRAFLGGTVAAAAGLAGCSGGGSGDGAAAASAPVDEYLADASNYDDVVDETGAAEVTVTVGTEANGGNFGFGPAAVRVDVDTTVVWEWNGLGNSHNVVAEDGSFESQLTAEKGHTFSETFAESGTTRYYCTPHETVGMKGVVIVE